MIKRWPVGCMPHRTRPWVAPASPQDMWRRASSAHRFLRCEPALLASRPTDRGWAYAPSGFSVNTAAASEGRSALPAAGAGATGVIRHDAYTWRMFAAAQARPVVSKVAVLAPRARAATRPSPVLAVQAVARASAAVRPIRPGSDSPTAAARKRSAAPTAEMGFSEPGHVGWALLDTSGVKVEVTVPALLADVPSRDSDAVVAVGVIAAARSSNQRPALHPLRPAGQHEHAGALYEESVTVTRRAGHRTVCSNCAGSSTSERGPTTCRALTDVACSRDGGSS